MAACIRRSYTSISKMKPKSPKTSILNLWFTQHCWYSGHCFQFRNFIKKSNYKEDKKLQIKHKQKLFFNIQHCCQNYSNRTCGNPLLKFHLSELNKKPFCWYNEIHINPVITTSIYVKPHLKR